MILTNSSSFFVFRQVILVATFLVIGNVFGQNSKIKSLETELLKRTNDSARISIINQIAYEFHNINPIITLEKSREALRLNESLDVNMDVEKAIAFKNIGLAHYKLSNFDSSLYYLGLSKDITDVLGNESLGAESLNVMAMVYKSRHQYALSLELSLLAYRTVTTLNDSAIIAIISINIGVMNKFMKNYDEALKYLNEGLIIGENIQDGLSICASFKELGDVYYRLGQYELSLEYLQKAVSYCTSIENNVLLAQAYFNLAQLYAETGKVEMAMAEFANAYNIQKAYDKKGQAATLNAMAKLNLANKELKAASMHLEMAYEIAKNSKLSAELRENYFQKIRLDTLRGDFSSAIRNYETYSAITDSINQIEKSREISQIKLQFETESLRKDKAFQQEELMRQQLSTWYSNAILVLTIIVIVFLAYFLVNKNKMNNRLKNYNEAILNHQEAINERSEEVTNANREIEKRNKELYAALQKLKETQTQLIASEKMASIGTLTSGIAHELNNPLNVIGGIIEPVRRDLSDLKSLIKTDKQSDSEFLFEEIDDLLISMTGGADKMSKIINNLVKISPGRQNLDEDVLIDLPEAIATTVSFMKKPNQNVLFEIDIEESLDIVANHADLSQVFINMINNAMDAFPKNESGEIRIKGYSENNTIVLEFTDNEPGIPVGIQAQMFEPFFSTKDPGMGTGLGLYICQSVVKKYSGEISVISELGKGTTFKIKLPTSGNSNAWSSS